MKPSINVPKFSRDIPLGDGSPVTMDIGDNVTASSNTTITIKCSVSGVPTPSVTWTRDGSKIVPGLKYSFTSDESLVIEGPETVDSGEYTCSAKSFLGTKSKTSTVKFLGQLWLNLKTNEIVTIVVTKGYTIGVDKKLSIKKEVCLIGCT